MRNFKITVNGIDYDVAVEEIEPGATGATGAAGAAGAAVQSSAARPVSEVAAPPAAKPASSETVPEGYRLEAPMPGKIADIRVEPGDRVKRGDPGIILEAMKMENEIYLPVGGKILSVNVSRGNTVKTGDLLLVIEQEV